MRNTHKMKRQAIDYYYGVNNDDLENTYDLESITYEQLYWEFIHDTSDDYELKLMSLYRKERNGANS